MQKTSPHIFAGLAYIIYIFQYSINTRDINMNMNIKTFKMLFYLFANACVKTMFYDKSLSWVAPWASILVYTLVNAGIQTSLPAANAFTADAVGASSQVLKPQELFPSSSTMISWKVKNKSLNCSHQTNLVQTNIHIQHEGAARNIPLPVCGGSVPRRIPVLPVKVGVHHSLRLFKNKT